MKQCLTTLAFVIATAVVGQTSEIELNYANGGYIELEKMGIDSKEGYTIEKTDLVFDEVFLRGDGPYSVLKLIRIEDKSIAAIMIAQDGVKTSLYCDGPKKQRGENNV